MQGLCESRDVVMLSSCVSGALAEAVLKLGVVEQANDCRPQRSSILRGSPCASGCRAGTVKRW